MKINHPEQKKMKVSAFNNQIYICVGLLTVYFQIPACRSLKEKRSVIKPVISRIQRDFQVAVSEVGYQDRWSESMIACVTASNDSNHTQSLLHKIYQHILDKHPEIVIVEHKIEFF